MSQYAYHDRLFSSHSPLQNAHACQMFAVAAAAAVRPQPLPARQLRARCPAVVGVSPPPPCGPSSPGVSARALRPQPRGQPVQPESNRSEQNYSSASDFRVSQTLLATTLDFREDQLIKEYCSF